MSLTRRIARPLLASVFITGGLDQLRQPEPMEPAAENVTPRVVQLPSVGEVDTETLVRVNGGVQLGAGSLLALGRLPRLSAVALAASMVPTTLGAHAFWRFQDPAHRQHQQTHFLKNASILGGLVIAAMDTEGRPGMGWRTRHRAEHARRAVRRTRQEARIAAKAKHAKAKPAKAVNAVRTAGGERFR